MPPAQLAQAAYRRADNLTPEVRLLNVFTEASPSNLKTGVDILTRPTLDTFASVGSGPIRCVFWKRGVFGSDALVVSGTTLYRVTEGAVVTSVGTVAGTGQVQIAASADKAMIATGGPLLSTDGATVATETFPDDQDVVSVGYINGYFLAVPANTARMYYTDPLTGDWDALRFVSAERYPDNVIRLVTTSDEVWLMGEESVEIFVPTGADTSDNPPFQRVEGRLYKKGVLAASTVVEADNSVLWAGFSAEDGVAVYRGGDVPTVISNPSISERLQRANPDDLSAWSFGWLGHEFYGIAMGAQGTWVCDISRPGTWLEWTSYQRDQWRAWVGRGCWPGVVLAGDDEDGTLWQLSDTGTDDGGVLITQTFPIGIPVDSQTEHTSLQVDMATGQADAVFQMRFSNDQGRTWVQMDDKTLIAGRYSQPIRWRRLGKIKPPGRICELTTTSAVRMRVSGARWNEAR